MRTYRRGILLLIFVVSTLSRLRNQEDLIVELKKELGKVRNEIRGEKEERKKALSELGDAVPIVQEQEIEEVILEEETPEPVQAETEEKILPPPLPENLQPSAANEGIKLTPDPELVVYESLAEEVNEETPEVANVTEPKKAPHPAPVREPAEPSQLQQFLQKVYLWPPSGDSAAEATIGAWWATRIGLVIAIISAVFGGIYVAEGAPPIARVAAMIVVSIVVTLLGLWLEKRVSGFGRLISAGGLGLGYFTAFASFALAPMKVIESPEIGILVQSIMVSVMVGWSLWKRDELVAGMAILLGYVSCWFSLQHDEMNFVITGLMILAIAGAFLLWKKGWLWSAAISVVGTWVGFFVLGVFEWDGNTGAAEAGFWSSIDQQTPSFAVLLGCLVSAFVIFELGHFFSVRNFLENSNSTTQQGSVADSTRVSRGKWLKRLTVLASSLSIFVGYLTIAETYPELKEWFFLTLAVVMLAWSLIHYYRKNGLSRGLDQMFFIKASGLLCLFFVAKFDGPVRWLSIAAQAGTVLWAWKRTGYRWVEAAFGVLFFVAVSVQIHEVTQHSGTEWSFFSVRNIVGVVALLALSFWMTLHRIWKFPDFEKPAPMDSSYNPFYVIAAILIAIAARFLAMTPWDHADMLRPVFLIVTGLIVAAPLLRWAKAGPVFAASGAIWMGFIHLIWYADRFPAANVPSLLLGAGALSVVIAELCRRGWQQHWIGGNVFRLIYIAFGAVLMFVGFTNLSDNVEGVSVLSLIAMALISGGLLWVNKRTIQTGHVSHSPESHTACQWVLAVLIGVLITFFTLGSTKQESPEFYCVWLALAGAIVLAVTFFVRNFIPSVAGGIPLVVALTAYLIEFGRSASTNEHLMVAGALLGIALGVLLVLRQFTRHLESQSLGAFETGLLFAATLIVHWCMRPFLDVSGIVAVNGMFALGLVLTARQWPMRNLKAASCFPVGFAILHVAAHFVFDYQEGARLWWWVGAVAVAAWMWIYHQGRQIQLLRDREEAVTAPGNYIVTFFAGAVFWAVSFFAVSEPWHPVAYAAFALLMLSGWRFCGVQAGHIFSWIHLASAAAFASWAIVEPGTNPDLALTSVLITAAMIIFHGTLFPRESADYRKLTLIHAIPALVLAFWACSPNTLSVDKLTTVCWGVASVALFVSGLVAALKTYRIAGLVGLVICIGRMFIVDIDDTLYRIIAFFAVAVVLLIIGFLYHRFRDRIENQFSGKSS